MTAPTVPGVVTADGIGEKRPTMNRLGAGRTVAIKPLRVETVNKADKQAPGGMRAVRRVHADVIVLDGPPITFGGNLNTQAPDTMAQPAPCIITQLWVDEVVLGNQIERFAGSGSYVVGKMKLLPPKDNGRPSWAIEDQTPADHALFMQWWNATSGGMNFNNPAPYPIAAPAAAPAQTAPAAAPATGGFVAAPAGWELKNWLQVPAEVKTQVLAAIAAGTAVTQDALGYPPMPVAAPAAAPAIPAQFTPNATPAAPAAAPAFDLAAFMAAKAAAAAPAAPVDEPPSGSGIDAGTWATLDDTTKAEIRAAMGALAASTPPGFA